MGKLSLQNTGAQRALYTSYLIPMKQVICLSILQCYFKNIDITIVMLFDQMFFFVRSRVRCSSKIDPFVGYFIIVFIATYVYSLS